MLQHAEKKVLGPLTGIKVIELATEGPVPFAARQLADLGARVVRIGGPRPSHDTLGVPLQFQFLAKGRETITIDLKTDDGRAAFFSLLDDADVLLEGYRPGVASRLGIGAAECLASNPRLVHAHICGYGDKGALACLPGHDLNFIALSGLLSTLGRAPSPPVPPQGLLADFGGGGTFLVIGVLAALLERAKSGRGQAVSLSMVAASAMLMAETYGLHAAGSWGRRGENLFDGGAPLYDCYETSDGRYMAVGALEPKYFAKLLVMLRLESDQFIQYDRTCWGRLRKTLEAAFVRRTQEEWIETFAGIEACVTPVLDLDQAPSHPQNMLNAVFEEHEGIVEPASPLKFRLNAGRGA